MSVSGEPAGPVLALPLLFQGEPIGRLVAAQRSPEEPFTAHERRLLATLAQHISIAAHAVRLTDDLQRSRERLVTAREEERRRLQRDLHDELGPTLASMSMQLDAGRALLAEDREAGEALLEEVQAQLRETIASVRRRCAADRGSRRRGGGAGPAGPRGRPALDARAGHRGWRGAAGGAWRERRGDGARRAAPRPRRWLRARSPWIRSAS